MAAARTGLSVQTGGTIKHASIYLHVSDGRYLGRGGNKSSHRRTPYLQDLVIFSYTMALVAAAWGQIFQRRRLGTLASKSKSLMPSLSTYRRPATFVEQVGIRFVKSSALCAVRQPRRSVDDPGRGEENCMSMAIVPGRSDVLG